MAHKTVTQTNSSAMRKITHTIIRNGIYYFNFRPPKDIVDAGLSKELSLRGSLKTSDPQVAKKRLADAQSRFWDHVELLRTDLEIEDDTKAKPKRTIYGLSKAVQRRVIEKHYQELELSQQLYRQQFADSQCELEKQQIMQNATDNISISSNEMTLDRWRQSTAALFNAKGYQCEPNDFDDEIVLFLKLAEVEIYSRTHGFIFDTPFKPATNEFSKISVYAFDKQSAASKTISDLTDEFLQSKKGKVDSKTSNAHAQAVKIIHDFLGKDLPLDTLTGTEGYEKGRSLILFLAKIPVNASQHYPNLGLLEASERESQKNTPRYIEGNTQRNLFLYINSIFKLAVNCHWLERNPLDGTQDILPSKVKNPVIMPTGADLTKMLSSQAFLRQKDPVKKTDNPGRYWTVLLCLFHGFRINEVASLMVTDIKEDNGIKYIDLSEFDDDGNRIKSLKTSASQRKVPIHRLMTEFGFFDYLDQIKSSDEERLFPTLKPDKHGNYGASVSKWFSRLRTKTLGETRKRAKTIHSVRHLVATKIRELTTSEELLWAIGGWSCGAKVNASRVYGQQSLKQMKDVIDQIEFGGFDPSNFHEIVTGCKPRIRTKTKSKD